MYDLLKYCISEVI